MRVPAWSVVAGFTLLIAAGAHAQGEIPYAIVFDGYMTPVAGAEALLTTQRLTAVAEDRWVPTTLGQERSRFGQALGILYRAGKFLALDVPQDHFLMVVAHEVFGHGARFRELGDGRIRYGFDAPPPYGDGEAFTSFFGEFPASPLANLNVSAAGIEAQHVLADAIADRAVSRGRMHYREAWLYFESRLTGMTYILSASPHSSPGHDIADFLLNFADTCRAECEPISRRTLQRRALFALADPLLYYSLYGFASSYIGSGSTTGPIPLVPIGGELQLMPSLGYAIAPYGTEWTGRLTFHRRASVNSAVARTSRFMLRIGDTGAGTAWGISSRVPHVANFKSLRIGAGADLWRQPPVLAATTSAPQHFGGGAAATVAVPLPAWIRAPSGIGLQVTAGYKTEGYVPGEQLSGGLVLRIGAALLR